MPTTDVVLSDAHWSCYWWPDAVCTLLVLTSSDVRFRSAMAIMAIPAKFSAPITTAVLLATMM
eukprot:3054944-Prymnesium_polylepis.2